MDDVYAVFNKYFQRQQIRFLFVGGINTLISAVFILILQYFMKDLITPQGIYVIGTFLCSIQSYFAMRIIVFKIRKKSVFEYLRYLSSILANCVFGILFLSCLVDLLRINAYLAHCINIMACALLQYTLLKYFAFRNTHTTKIEEKSLQ